MISAVRRTALTAASFLPAMMLVGTASLGLKGIDSKRTPVREQSDASMAESEESVFRAAAAEFLIF